MNVASWATGRSRPKANKSPRQTRALAVQGMTQTKVLLKEVTADTVRAVTELQVTPEQRGYVASNAVSIAQAYFHREAWFRAIYAEAELIGFAMLRDHTLPGAETPRPEVSLWRFMIDQRFQKQGYGRRALELVVAHAASRPGVKTLGTSYVVGPHGPKDFYLAFGFRHTGEVKPNGEVCLSLDLQLMNG